MSMRAGLLLTAVHDASTPPSQQVAEHRELVQTAEQLGFDLIVCGQHFLGTELRYYQPIPYLTHMAAAAPSMRVATGIILLSMLNPVQVAEDVATLDVVTGGRATFGAAVGYSPREFQAFGVERGDRVARFEEALALIKKLWSGEEVEHAGVHFRLEGAVRPSVLPAQRPRPPIWLGGQAAGSVRRAARLGDAWYAPPFPTHDALRQLQELFAEERDRAGLPPAAEFPVRRELLIADSKLEARRGAAMRSRARYQTYLQWGLAQGGDLDDSGGGFAQADDAEAEGRFLLGSPAEVAEGLARLRDEVGMTHFVFKPQWPGLPHAEAMRQLERFGAEVLPLLSEDRKLARAAGEISGGGA
jgi:alkanesulfonate monooxygenase SsuD/methylene tetrahydromethanopterin reductase-like flavin-dependent oxidoreductase (luciferase family)